MLNEFWAYELLNSKADLNFEKFYRNDLIIMLNVCFREYKKLKKQLKEGVKND